jgi:hypothetical protein
VSHPPKNLRRGDDAIRDRACQSHALPFLRLVIAIATGGRVSHPPKKSEAWR